MKEADAAEVRELAQGLSRSELIATLLLHRGVDSVEAAERFLKPRLSGLPDPFSMKGMEEAVVRIVAAIEAGERVCVWGDYDVDGVTSSSQLIWFFRTLGLQLEYLVPDRFADGYGLNEAGIRELCARGVQLIITVDCGVSNVSEVAVANALGTDVIIVDHHQLPPVLPPALAILDPHQDDCPYPYKGLAACGVTFQLLIALRARLRERGFFASRPEPDLREFLDLTAIGTIADMVPLTGVNRIIVTYGLETLWTTPRPGVRALCEVSRLQPQRVRAGSVGFQLGPRINAAGRMAHASAGVELMTTEDSAYALEVANGVDEHNLARREVQQSIFEAACVIADEHPEPAERRSLVLAAEGWHTGVVGIVASKVVERYHRPAILLAIDGDVAKGSARSIPGFKLVEHLRALDEYLDKYGGHDYAAGMTLPVSKLAAFTEAFEARAREALEPRHLRKRLRIDAEVPLQWVGSALISDLETLAPFGQGNPEPVLMAKHVRVFDARTVGKDQIHVKLRLDAGWGTIDAIAFSQVAQMPTLGSFIDVAYVPEYNIYRGEARLQLRVKAMRPSSMEDLQPHG